MTLFEFRDSVLREVMKAFGTLNFRDWYFNQNTSVFVNDMHKRFLVDTLNYITTGEREFELATWDSLLSKEQVPTPLIDMNSMKLKLHSLVFLLALVYVILIKMPLSCPTSFINGVKRTMV